MHCLLPRTEIFAAGSACHRITQHTRSNTTHAIIASPYSSDSSSSPAPPSGTSTWGSSDMNSYATIHQHVDQGTCSSQNAPAAP
eukprot:2320823-Rhodomonas_salina.1